MAIRRVGEAAAQPLAGTELGATTSRRCGVPIQETALASRSNQCLGHVNYLLTLR